MTLLSYDSTTSWIYNDSFSNIIRLKYPSNNSNALSFDKKSLIDYTYMMMKYNSYTEKK